MTTSRGVVAADHEAAAEVGARILAQGGNAVDAAAATALALGVINPTSSGLGGGGFALVYLARERRVRAVDFREVGPAAIDPGDFLTPAGAIDPERSRTGGLAVGVPGEPAGLHHIVATWGVTSWRRVVAPSIRLARDGFVVSSFFAAKAAEMVPLVPADRAYEPVRALLASARAGATITRPALATTLAALATGGGRAFYRGTLAADVVATARRAGGVMTADDLARYRVMEREPLWGTWRGLRVATMPLPSSGGVILLEAFGLLESSGRDLARLAPAAQLHLVAEILKHVFADRARWLGDRADAYAIAARLLEPARLSQLARTIDMNRTQPSERYGAAPVTAGGGGTSHLCVIDADGNAVALTTTVNGYFGSLLVTQGGVVLNDQIDDFSLAAGQVNQFGLVQSEANLVGGGKRPLSSMSPTLVFEGDKVVACVGASGGPRIISATFLALVGVFVLGRDVSEAVTAPRVHHQWAPNELRVEPALPADVVAALRARGHAIAPTPRESYVQMIRVRPDATREAASDPGKGGAPVAERKSSVVSRQPSVPED